MGHVEGMLERLLARSIKRKEVERWCEGSTGLQSIGRKSEVKLCDDVILIYGISSIVNSSLGVQLDPSCGRR